MFGTHWDFASAGEYLDKVLDEDAEYAPAYIGKVLVSLKLNREEELKTCLSLFEETGDWKKALRFATPQQKQTYENYVGGAEIKANEDWIQKGGGYGG